MSKYWIAAYLVLFGVAYYFGPASVGALIVTVLVMNYRAIGRSFWPRHFLCRFQWYRRWHGGRWELWWIEICGSHLWLDIDPEIPDDWRQPCSAGPRLEREDWPVKSA